MEGLQKGLDGVIAGGKHAVPVAVYSSHTTL